MACRVVSKNRVSVQSRVCTTDREYYLKVTCQEVPGCNEEEMKFNELITNGDCAACHHSAQAIACNLPQFLFPQWLDCVATTK